MKMRRFLLAALAVSVAISMTAVPALAHHSESARSIRHSEDVYHHSTCRYEDCTRTGLHQHSGDLVIYSGHRSYVTAETPAYIACSVEGCALTGVHHHDGVPYSGHHTGTGAAVTYAACDLDSCDLVDCHEHDGTYYYGHYNADGTIAYIMAASK